MVDVTTTFRENKSNVENIDSHSEIIVKYILEKLISFTNFKHYMKNIDKNINLHCYDVFTEKVITDLVHFNNIAYEKDEFSDKVTGVKEHKVFYNQVYHGNNDWSQLLEPIAPKVDSMASTMIKSKIAINEYIQEETISKPNESITKTNPLPLKRTQTILDRNKLQLLLKDEKKEIIDKKDGNDLVDLKNPELYTYIEEDSIKFVREKKEEEWKMKVIEIANKEKNDKELQERIIEQNRRQREYDRRNVTADCNGCVIVIKAAANEKLVSDFNMPKTNLKEYISKETVETPSKTPLDIKNKLPEKVEVKSISEVKKDTVKGTILNKSTTYKKRATMMTNKLEIVENNNNLDQTKNSLFYKENKAIIQPIGSNFEYFLPEVGVCLTENTKSKNGGKDFSSFFGKPSKYDYLNLTKENVKKTLMNNTNYLSLTEPSDKSSQLKVNNTKIISSSLGNNIMEINLPPINNRNHTLLLQTTTTPLTNNTIESLKISRKINGTLKSTLDSLDLIPEYNENAYESNNIDIFKKRKVYLNDKKDFQRTLISTSLDKINQFNYSIMKDSGWGQSGAESLKVEQPKMHYKPNRKKLEKELGQKIVNTKLPRSRMVANSLNKMINL